MQESNAQLFERLLTQLRGEGMIRSDGDGVYGSSISPNDKPEVIKYIPDIGKLLYSRLASAEIEFDAIASIPSGGDLYTAEVLRHYREEHGREIPLLQLTRKYRTVNGFKKHPAIKKGARVVLIDDSVYSGNTARGAIEALQKGKLKAVALLCVAQGSDTPRWFPSILSVFSRKQIELHRRQPLDDAA